MTNPRTIEVLVKLLPPLSTTARRDRVRLSLDGERTIRGVIEALVRRFENREFYHHLYDTEGRIIPGWCVFVNDRPVPLNSRDGTSTPVKEGDEISFLLNLAGG